MGCFCELYLAFEEVFIIQSRRNILFGHILHFEGISNANNGNKKEKDGKKREAILRSGNLFCVEVHGNRKDTVCFVQ